MINLPYVIRDYANSLPYAVSLEQAAYDYEWRFWSDIYICILQLGWVVCMYGNVTLANI